VPELPAASTRLEWVHPPRQARSRRTLERILDAAERLLDEKGFDDLSVHEVAQRARSSVGAFYTRFEDKDGLLHALHERFSEEAFATADRALDPARWRGATIAEILSSCIPFLVRITRERAGLIRAVLLRAAVDGAFAERAARLSRHVIGGLDRLLLARRDEIGHAEPEVAAQFAWRVVFSVLNQNLLDVGAYEAISDDRLAVELTRTANEYLGLRAGVPEE
jgi:AcrR family transcriptional regulator